MRLFYFSLLVVVIYTYIRNYNYAFFAMFSKWNIQFYLALAIKIIRSNSVNWVVASTNKNIMYIEYSAEMLN